MAAVLKASDWDRIVAAAERYGPDMSRDILEEIGRVRGDVSADTIVRALEGSVQDLLELMSVLTLSAAVFAVLDDAARGASRVSAGIVWDQLGPTMPGRFGPAQGGWYTRGAAGSFRVDFAAVDEYAAEWARENAGRLITAITGETRDAIRLLVSQGPVEGISVYQQARLIRDMVGLNERQGRAVVNRYRALLRRWQAGSLTWRQLERQISRYITEQIRYRAWMIARTETMNAAHWSLIRGWREAARAGLFDPSTAYIGWSAVSGACEICLEMQRSGRWPVDNPPDRPHPNCRCSAILITG